ncbi:MAG TPA: DUF4398 domain-containing protein [bacterium]|nr:DUF4398 domain-containing protein [bacterium]
MRKRKAVALAGFVLVLCLTLCGCASRSQALKDAQSALDSAQSAGAPSKSPQVYEQAKKHLDQGRQYDFQFRYGLARVEYEAAAADARLAAALASGAAVEMAAPPQILAPAAVESAPLPPPVEAHECGRLKECESARSRIESALARCEAGSYVRTRVIREPCEEAAAPAAPSGPAARLMGTLVVMPPEAIVKGRSDYKIKVKYVASELDKGKAGDADYRILLDIAGVEPAEAEAMSPMSDFQPLGSGGGEWTLPVTAPEGVAGEVKVMIEATLRNSATGKEQKLPGLTAVIPNARACPACAPCPKVEMAPAPAGRQKAAGNDWLTRILFLIVGLGAGAGVGFFIFRKGGKSGPTIKIGE